MTDTSIIEDKKKTQNQTPKNDIYKFLIDIFTHLIVFGILIVIGSLCLYSGKVAQANILPTCLSQIPYTGLIPEIKQVVADINIVKTDKGNFSTKIEFPLQENFKIINNTLGILNDWINGPNSNVYKLYIATTLQQLIACNFTVTNNINNFMNSMLSETWFILLAPYVLFFTGMLTVTINTFYMIMLWFYNIYLLFSEKTESKNKTTWRYGEMWGMFNWGFSALYIFIFVMLFFIIGIGVIIPLTAFLISLFCTVFPLFMTSKNNQTGKSYGISETIKNVVKFKLNIIMIIMSFYIISSANNNFGGYSAFVAVVACVLLYFFSSVYHQYIPKTSDHVSLGLGDYVQAIKICSPIEVSDNNQSMFEKIRRLFGG
jgi:hypothetical protein